LITPPPLNDLSTLPIVREPEHEGFTAGELLKPSTTIFPSSWRTAPLQYADLPGVGWNSKSPFFSERRIDLPVRLQCEHRAAVIRIGLRETDDENPAVRIDGGAVVSGTVILRRRIDADSAAGERRVERPVVEIARDARTTTVSAPPSTDAVTTSLPSACSAAPYGYMLFAVAVVMAPAPLPNVGSGMPAAVSGSAASADVAWTAVKSAAASSVAR
jgi:hypothetical protein